MQTHFVLALAGASPETWLAGLILLTLGSYVYFKWRNKKPKYPDYDKLFRDS